MKIFFKFEEEKSSEAERLCGGDNKRKIFREEKSSEQKIYIILKKALDNRSRKNYISFLFRYY